MASVPPSILSRRLRRIALALLAIVVLAAGLFISVKPAVELESRPRAEDVRAAREAWEQLKAAQASDAGVAPIQLDDRMVRGLAALASDANGKARFEAQVADGVLSGRASIGLAAGLWVNLTATTSGRHSGFPPIRLTVGRVRFPIAAGRWFAEAARSIIRLKGLDVPELDHLVRQVRITPQGVSAELALPGEGGLVGSIMAARGKQLDHQLVGAAFCRMAAAQRRQPSSELSVLVRRTFAQPSEGEDQRRAKFVALAFLVVGERAEALVPRAGALARDCPSPALPVLLQGRADLAQHWTFSAALVAALGPQAAQSLGEWKELDDSLPAGSGFSFVDIAADRAGLRTALRALDPVSAGAAVRQLSVATEETLLPRVLLQAPEGLSEADFRDSFGGLDQAEYAQAITAIDRILARTGP